jgi:hypothetical protein
MIQWVSIGGAMVILAAYLANLYGGLSRDGRTYLALNVLGAGTLTVIAWIERQWGFLLMESVWTAASLLSLVRRAAAGQR